MPTAGDLTCPAGRRMAGSAGAAPVAIAAHSALSRRSMDCGCRPALRLLGLLLALWVLPWPGLAGDRAWQHHAERCPRSSSRVGSPAFSWPVRADDRYGAVASVAALLTGLLEPGGRLLAVAGEAEIFPERHWLAVASLTTEVEVGSGVSLLCFNLHEDIEVKQLSIGGTPAAFERSGNRVLVSVAVATAGRRLSLWWQYEGDPSNIAGANVVWDYIGRQGCYLKTSANYYPHLGMNQPAAGTWTIVAPASWTMVTQGRPSPPVPLERNRRQWRFRTDIDVDGFSLVGGQYWSLAATVDGVDFTVMMRPHHRDKAGRYLALLVDVIRHHAGCFGPFPFRRMTMAEVEGEFPMGYGSQELLVMTGREFDKFLADPAFVAHEAAHQWWGNHVMARFPDANWLNEGFATFSQLEYLASRQGESAFVQELGTRLDSYLGVAGSGFDHPIASRQLLRSPAYQTIVYDKGAMLLLGLRRWLGSASFWQLIRGYGQRHARRVVGFADFYADLALHSPEALAYLRPWLDSVGGPRIRVGAARWSRLDAGRALVEVSLRIADPSGQGRDRRTAGAPLATGSAEVASAPIGEDDGSGGLNGGTGSPADTGAADEGGVSAPPSAIGPTTVGTGTTVLAGSQTAGVPGVPVITGDGAPSGVAAVASGAERAWALTTPIRGRGFGLPLAIPVRIDTLSGTHESVFRFWATSAATLTVAVPGLPVRVRVDPLGEVINLREPPVPASGPAADRPRQGVVLIYGTHDPNPRVNAFMRIWAQDLAQGSQIAMARSDRELDDLVATATGYLLLGIPANNRFIASLTGHLPVTAIPGRVTCRGRSFSGRGAAVTVLFRRGDLEVVWFGPTDILAWQRFQPRFPKDGDIAVRIDSDTQYEGWLSGVGNDALLGGPLQGSPAWGQAGLRR